MERPSSLPESAGPGDDPDPGHLHLSAPPAGPPPGVLAALRPLLRQCHHGGQVYRRNHSNPDLGIVPKTSGIHDCFFTLGVY